jgi:hypothetical protein
MLLNPWDPWSSNGRAEGGPVNRNHLPRAARQTRERETATPVRSRARWYATGGNRNRPEISTQNPPIREPANASQVDPFFRGPRFQKRALPTRFGVSGYAYVYDQLRREVVARYALAETASRVARFLNLTAGEP